jgi:hypothetical protein
MSCMVVTDEQSISPEMEKKKNNRRNDIAVPPISSPRNAFICGIRSAPVMMMVAGADLPGTKEVPATITQAVQLKTSGSSR